MVRKGWTYDRVQGRRIKVIVDNKTIDRKSIQLTELLAPNNDDQILNWDKSSVQICDLALNRKIKVKRVLYSGESKIRLLERQHSSKFKYNLHDVSCSVHNLFMSALGLGLLFESPVGLSVLV